MESLFKERRMDAIQKKEEGSTAEGLKGLWFTADSDCSQHSEMSKDEQCILKNGGRRKGDGTETDEVEQLTV